MNTLHHTAANRRSNEEVERNHREGIYAQEAALSRLTAAKTHLKWVDLPVTVVSCNRAPFLRLEDPSPVRIHNQIGLQPWHPSPLNHVHAILGAPLRADLGQKTEHVIITNRGRRIPIFGQAVDAYLAINIGTEGGNSLANAFVDQLEEEAEWLEAERLEEEQAEDLSD